MVATGYQLGSQHHLLNMILAIVGLKYARTTCTIALSMHMDCYSLAEYVYMSLSQHWCGVFYVFAA